ncbi:MAG: MBL fold metallo-hydrolase [Betaproteobacteria bacterium]|nr:MAG: MBL fold metallo-hydrolase [Betaproteobacteria bacterium]
MQVFPAYSVRSAGVRCPSRRNFLSGTAALAATAALAPLRAARAQGAPKPKTRLVLLGTGGGPRIVAPGRSKSANLIVINGVPYVVDCGEGVAHQLVRAGVALNTLRYVFITHHHSDHNLDYGNLIHDSWAAGLRAPVDTYGPPPIKAMTEAYWQLNRFDIETRIADEGRPDLRKLVTAHEFAEPGPVMQNADVKVTAALVRHPPIVHAYAYRFDAADRAIVISGDTAYSPELIALAKGADVLVSEVMHLAGLENLLKRVPNAATLREHLLASHIVTEDLGKLAAAAGVKTLVLTHLVPPDDNSITDDMWMEGVRKHYGGTIIVGRDLLEI